MLFRKNHIKMEMVVNGTESAKKFVNKTQALRYMNSVLDKSNLQVEEIISSNTKEEYYCNDHSRFMMYSIQ